MRGPGANASAASAPLDPAFDAFLFASVGEEKNNMVLTVLSALARLGVDPWQESARLAQLSPEAAAQRLTAIISGVPSGQWVPADAGIIATRLVKLLPVKRVFDAPARMPVARPATAKARIAMLLFFAALGGLICFAIANPAHPAPQIDVHHSDSAGIALPPGRVADNP